MWKGKMNIYKVCDFLFEGQAIPEEPFQGILAHNYNYLKINTRKNKNFMPFFVVDS